MKHPRPSDPRWANPPGQITFRPLLLIPPLTCSSHRICWIDSFERVNSGFVLGRRRQRRRHIRMFLAPAKDVGVHSLLISQLVPKTKSFWKFDDLTDTLKEAVQGRLGRYASGASEADPAHATLA